MEKFIQKFQDWFHDLPAGKRRQYILVCTAAAVFLLTFSVILSFQNSSGKNDPLDAQRTRFNLAIPAEELFLPDEPDFLPGVLLERERRTAWTEEDAIEYWQDPLRQGEEQWRQKIEAAIDEFLERVP